MTVAQYIETVLLSGKRAQHASGALAYPRSGAQPFGVSLPSGRKAYFDTAREAAEYAARAINGKGV
jgi:hypothetical protein